MEDDVILTPESKQFFRRFGFIMALVVLYGIYNIFIAKNFLVAMHLDCDPRTQSCFVATCNPKLDTCSGNPVEDTEFFGMIQKKGYDYPKCDLNEDACREQVVCRETDKVCNIVFCNEDTILEDGRCSTEADVPLYLEIQANADAETEAGTETEADTDTDNETEAGTDNDIGAVLESEPDAETAIDAVHNASDEAGNDTQTNTHADTKTDSAIPSIDAKSQIKQ